MSEQVLTPERLAELGRIAEAADFLKRLGASDETLQKFYDEFNPPTALAMVAEIERLRREREEDDDKWTRYEELYVQARGQIVDLQLEIERLRREREGLVEALMPASEALADLDQSYYRVARQDPTGYAMGSVSVASLVTVIESTRKALALLDGEKGGGGA